MNSTANLATYADDLDLLRDKSPNMKNYIDELQSGNVPVTSVSGTYTALSTDNVLAVSTAAARAITIPASSAGKFYTVKDVTGSGATNNITITPASGTIDGASSKVINTNYGYVRIFTDGTNWFTF